MIMPRSSLFFVLILNLGYFVTSLLLLIGLLFIPTDVYAANEGSVALAADVNLNLTHHIVGYLSIIIAVCAYVAAMSEDIISLRKSKPMVLAAALKLLKQRCHKMPSSLLTEVKTRCYRYRHLRHKVDVALYRKVWWRILTGR